MRFSDSVGIWALFCGLHTVNLSISTVRCVIRMQQPAHESTNSCGLRAQNSPEKKAERIGGSY